MLFAEIFAQIQEFVAALVASVIPSLTEESILWLVASFLWQSFLG